jgi:hypothetical protein
MPTNPNLNPEGHFREVVFLLKRTSSALRQQFFFTSVINGITHTPISLSSSRAFLVVSTILLSISSVAIAQETRVLTELDKQSTSSNPVIQVKWYSGDVIYAEGVNIYRREAGTLNWEKLNPSPIMKKKTIPPASISGDPDMADFAEMVNTATPAELKQEMLLFNLLVKSFQSNIFSDFMGIYFRDVTVKNGTTYEYKVSKLKSGREIPIGVTVPILAESYKPAPPITNIQIAQDGKRITLSWDHEHERYYAVNIYRRSSKESIATKLNTQPIVLTEVTDSAGNVGYAKPMFAENLRLKEGEVYYYQLSGAGFFEQETALSEPVKVEFKDVTPPPAPQNLEAKADSMKVNLRWENVPVEDLKELRIYRSVKSDGPYDVISNGVLPISSNAMRDSVRVPGPYYYFVASVDHAGNEGHSNLMFVEAQDVMPPAKPLGLVLKSDTGKIALTWRKGNEPDLAGYYIYRTVDGHTKKNYVLLNAEPLNADRFEQKLPKNVKNTFFYFIVAVDTSYNRSIASDFVSGKMPDILAPEKPFIKDISYDAGNVVVEWLRNVDPDLAGYHLYRSDTAMKFSRVNVNMLGRETFRYTDRSTEPNTDYYYYLVASDSTGNTSIPSKQVYARRVVEDIVPEGKITLKIKSNKKKKKSALSWEHKEISAAVSGYVVFRGENESDLKPITGLIQTKNYTDVTTENNPAYYYQVRAYAENAVFRSSIVR